MLHSARYRSLRSANSLTIILRIFSSKIIIINFTGWRYFTDQNYIFSKRITSNCLQASQKKWYVADSIYFFNHLAKIFLILFFCFCFFINEVFFFLFKGLNKAAETLKQEAELTTTIKTEEKTMPGTPSITIPKDAFEMSSVKSNHNTPVINKSFSAVLDSTPFSSPPTERRVNKFLLFYAFIGT